MEKSLGYGFEYYMDLIPGMKQADPKASSSIVLAYIGDCVFDLIIKMRVVGRGGRQVHKLHEETSRYVQASAQSFMMRAIQEHLTEEEHAVYRRGRNTRSVSAAKNQSITDYRRATGFEALVGYLYLKKEYKRLVELVTIGLESMEKELERREKRLKKLKKQNEHTLVIEGRNAVLEAFRSGRTIDKLFVLDGCQDGPVRTIVREAKKHGTILNFVGKERLSQLTQTGRHQGVIAYAAAYDYAEIDDMLKLAEKRGEDPFLIVLDGIEDPHNLGAIIRTANIAGAHGVIIPKRRAVGLTATVAKTSAGALNYTPVAKVTNLVKTMEELKEKGIWFVCADMDGQSMYDMNLTGPIGLVVGNEGDGVSRLVKENCDFVASIPMKGEITSLNASVAGGVLAYEIVRQRLAK